MPLRSCQSERHRLSVPLRVLVIVCLRASRSNMLYHTRYQGEPSQALLVCESFGQHVNKANSAVPVKPTETRYLVLREHKGLRTAPELIHWLHASCQRCDRQSPSCEEQENARRYVDADDRSDRADCQHLCRRLVVPLHDIQQNGCYDCHSQRPHQVRTPFLAVPPKQMRGIDTRQRESRRCLRRLPTS